MSSRRKRVRHETPRDHSRAEPVVGKSTAQTAAESRFVPGSPTAKVTAIAAAIFVIAHLLLMIGLTTPEKLYFDEVHYVPAARQMLEAGPHVPLLNPMHPPLAKQLMALSIRAFGDVPLGWRYPGVLFGSLSVVAIYLCGLALFAAQGPAIAAASFAFLNQMLFVQSRIAMLDIDSLALGLLGMAAFMHGFRQQRPHPAFALAGLAFGLSIACKWSGLFPLAVAIGIIGMVRLLQGWHTTFAGGNDADWYRPDLWPDFKYHHAAACFMLIPAIVYLATFVPLYGLSLTDILEAQRKIFSENTTTSIADHPYMSAWPSWPLLVRPVWYLFENVGDNLFQAIIFLGNPLVLWPAVAALGVCLYDWIVKRRADAFLILAFYLGPWLAWAMLTRKISFLYYYLPSATVASLALVYVLTRGNCPRWLLWGCVAIAGLGFIVMLPITMSTLETSIETYRRLMIFKSWI